MNQKQTRILDMMIRAHDYVIAYPLTPANAVATALTTNIATYITQMQNEGADQTGGRSERAAGVGDRRTASKLLREMLGELAKTAGTMDLTVTPAAAEVRMPRGSSYQALRDAAQAVSEVVAANKAAFVALEWPETVDTELTALIAQFDDALGRKNHGSGVAVGSTAALEASGKAGVKDVRALDAIVSKRWKSDAALLAGWKSASHIERTLPKETEPAAPMATALLAAPVGAEPAPTVTVAA